MDVANTKKAFHEHLSRTGFLMDQPPQVVRKELARTMGPDRFAEYQRLMSRVRKDESAENRVYDFMRDLREANLLRSLSPDVTLETSYYLYEKAAPLLTPGATVIELACWTGGLCSFIAENHPACTVVGVDRARRILNLTGDYYHLPNLGFRFWDYRDAKPNDLEPADVLLCGLGTSSDRPLGVYSIQDCLGFRESKGFQQEKGSALRYFVHWREAAKDDAMLLTALKVSAFPQFLALMDAAREAGWTAMLDHSVYIQCPANKESVPSFIFKAQPCEMLDEDEMLSHWMRICCGSPKLGELIGPAALGLYRSLGPKRVLARREIRNKEGLMTWEELGICDSFGYVYRQDPQPNHRLELMPIDHARRRRV